MLIRNIILKSIFALFFSCYSFSLFAQWVPDSTYVQEVEPIIVENSMNAVVRLQTKAFVRLKLEQLTDEMRIDIYENDSFTYYEEYQRRGEYLQFASLPLDKLYSVVQHLSDGTQMIVAYIDTRNRKKEPIEVSDILAQSLEKWVVMETNEQPRALNHIAEDESLDYAERLYYIQRFYDVDQHFGDDLIGTDPPEFGDEDIPVDYLDLDDLPGFEEHLEEEEEDDCNCNYVLKIKRQISPGFPDPANKRQIYNYINHGKWYYNKGPKIYSHLEEWNSGPAKQHFLITENTKTKGPNRDATRGNLLENTSKSKNVSQLYWHLVCDKTASGKAVPEKCLCEKELTICYQYDTKLIADAQSINCFLCGDKGAAATAEDWAAITLTRYQVNKDTEVLETSRGIMKSSCEDVGPLNTIAQIADFAAKMAEVLFPFAGKITLTKDKGVWVVKPEFTITIDVADQIKKLAAAVESGTKIFETPKGTCENKEATPTLLKDCRVIALNANEPLELTMYSAHQLSAGAKRSGRGIAKVISGYYMSGTLTTNLSQKELDYCCLKKIGSYNSDAPTLSPVSMQTYQDYMGYNFGNVGPWDAPYNKQNPRIWNSSDIEVPFWVDNLSGSSGCDDVLIERSVAPEQSEYLQTFQARFENNTGLVIKGNTELREIAYAVYDLTGQIIAQGKTVDPDMFLLSENTSSLSSGIYLVSLRELGSSKVPHTIKVIK